MTSMHSPVQEVRLLLTAHRSQMPIRVAWRALEAVYGRQGTRDLLWTVLCAEFLNEDTAQIKYDKIIEQVRETR